MLGLDVVLPLPIKAMLHRVRPKPPPRLHAAPEQAFRLDGTTCAASGNGTEVLLLNRKRTLEYSNRQARAIYRWQSDRRSTKKCPAVRLSLREFKKGGAVQATPYGDWLFRKSRRAEAPAPPVHAVDQEHALCAQGTLRSGCGAQGWVRALRTCRQLRLVPLKRVIDPLGVEAVSARHTDRAVRMTGQIQEPAASAGKREAEKDWSK
jgi:hypothetical protein